MSPFAIIVLSSALLAYLAIGVTYAVSTAALARTLGPVSYPIPGKAWRQFHGILVITPFLPVVALLRGLEPLVVVAVTALAVLCFMIALRDVMYGRLSGIHQTGFVWNGTVIMFCAVAAVDASDPAALVVLTRSGTSHTIVPQDSGIMVALLSAIGDALCENPED
jgi:hypothetical protein